MAPRAHRSPTRKSVARASRPDYAEAESDSNGTGAGSGRHQRRRSKPGARGGRSVKPARRDRTRRGQATAGGLLSLPSELLQSCFSLVGHEEIEALTHTCRTFRTLILTRATGLVVYRRVFARLFDMYLPEPPPWLSLPVYNSLLCLKACTVSLSLSRRG